MKRKIDKTKKRTRMAIIPGTTFFQFTRRILPSTGMQTLFLSKRNNFTRENSTNSSSKVLEHLKNRSLIRVSGNEGSDFLQGLVTNDMRHFEDGAANIYTLFLNTKGRVMGESIIYKTLENSTYYVECDSRMINDLQKHLRMYRIRRQVDIVSLENEMKVWSIFDSTIDVKDDGTENNTTNGKLEGQIFPCGTLTNKSTKLVDDIVIYEDPRIAETSLRILSKANVTRDEIVKHLDFDVTISDDNLSNYRSFRYQLGIAEGIDDLPIGKALPLEINCDYLHGVSFHKGCYIGQELTARTHHTGVVRKRLMPIIINDCANENFNYDESIVDETGKVAGKFRGKVGIYGLGLMRIVEALNARKLKILEHPVSVTKPRWWPKEARNDKATVDSEKMEGDVASIEDSQIPNERISGVEEAKKSIPGGTFKCSHCPLEEHYDYRGGKPPFARQINFSEDCYVMKDPMSLPNRGEVLVLGGDCSFCKKNVCLDCSVFYSKRFCRQCALDSMNDLPPQLHGKIKSMTSEEKS